MKVIGIGIMISVLSACSILPEKRVFTQIEINASSKDIWNVLVDTDHYSEWNPYHVKVQGKLKEGETLEVDIHKPNGNRINIHPQVIEVLPEKRLIWGGGILGLFIGEHVFELQKTSNQSTLLIQRELFTGIAIPFAELDTIEEGYQLMNKALKKKVEADKSKI